MIVDGGFQNRISLNSGWITNHEAQRVTGFSFMRCSPSKRRTARRTFFAHPSQCMSIFRTTVTSPQPPPPPSLAPASAAFFPASFFAPSSSTCSKPIAGPENRKLRVGTIDSMNEEGNWDPEVRVWSRSSGLPRPLSPPEQFAVLGLVPASGRIDWREKTRGKRRRGGGKSWGLYSRVKIGK